MPSVQYLREFINERLTAAAEEIFSEFEKTIVQYEEEIDRQRRLLDITWKPEIKLRRTDLPQQCVNEEEEEVLIEQPLHNLERSSSLNQEEPEPPWIKEEEEELCSSQEAEQLVLKEESVDIIIWNKEERNHQPELQHDVCRPQKIVSEGLHRPEADGGRGGDLQRGGKNHRAVRGGAGPPPAAGAEAALHRPPTSSCL
ncbi:uncharacterized protein LOC115796436 isoform X3 [Archocentrus centrarchus]|uniref:uncharacterized protein LOC115796436 isoform X3 n=1 Tax=Archocentrus centrarchus TaxID=63155 RepID=UPI0011E9CEFB|nr:uncharacterized protein LOC115796436 isoform X3 [Archocentrus centrarchus]